MNKRFFPDMNESIVDRSQPWLLGTGVCAWPAELSGPCLRGGCGACEQRLLPSVKSGKAPGTGDLRAVEARGAGEGVAGRTCPRPGGLCPSLLPDRRMASAELAPRSCV